ncbi:MAG: helix-turn-helix domain-containing protein [Clostridia bacterium]|nr:helix-turn-helix domain-containing protein [Clostridia bacterium]
MYVKYGVINDDLCYNFREIKMYELFERHRDIMKECVIWDSGRVYCLPHYHSGVEIVYVLEGKVTAVIGGRNVSAGAGEVFVSGCYTVHSYGDELSPAVVTIIPPGEVPAIEKMLISGRFVSPVFRDDTGELKEMLMLLKNNHQDSTVRMGMCYAILGFIMKKAGFEATDSAHRGGVMAEVLSYLTKNYAQNNLSAQSLAAYFGYSRSRFSHLFKANIGVSIPRYINILRCRNAAKVLVETDMAVVDVAINAGFNNSHTFYVAFREIYGMTPGDYVKAARDAAEREGKESGR